MSTERAVELGDAGWRELLERHHALVRRELARHQGVELDTAGDGFFATFDGPARAVRAALAIRDALRGVGVEIRSGVHTGEVELHDGKVVGIAVSIWPGRLGSAAHAPLILEAASARRDGARRAEATPPLARGRHHGPMGAIRRRSFHDPEGIRELPLLTVRLARIGSNTIGWGVVQPGWHWAEHLGPTMRAESCPVHHVQILVSGHFTVRMDDGEEVAFQPGDVMDVPPGHDAWVVGDEPVELIDFAGNIDALGLPREHERIVTTLLMTDVVDSTRTAQRLGDAAWKQVLSDHNRLVRAQLLRFGGSEVNTTGDGFLATFRSAVAALRCAAAIVDALSGTGIGVRVGVHTGEVEPIGNDIGGVAVHAAARIMSLAGPSEVFASAMTVGLADGSGLAFESRGAKEVKGLDRAIDVFRLA